MAGANILPIDIAQFLAHPELAALDAPTLGWLLKAVMLSWQQQEPCTLPLEESAVRAALGCGNEYQWNKAWAAIRSWYKPLAGVRICKPLRRTYASSQRSLGSNVSLLTFPAYYDEAYFLVKEPSVKESLSTKETETKVISISSKLHTEVKGGEGTGEEPSRLIASMSQSRAAAPEWMWNVCLECGMVSAKSTLLPLRRSRLRLFFEEQLWPRRNEYEPSELFRTVLNAVQTRPWWGERPTSWDPQNCFNSPVNRESHMLYALGQHPEQTNGRASNQGRANGALGSAQGQRSSARYGQYVDRNKQGTER